MEELVEQFRSRCRIVRRGRPLGLEFELASDIIGTVVSPTWQHIGELGAIAVIRTS